MAPRLGLTPATAPPTLDPMSPKTRPPAPDWDKAETLVKTTRDSIMSIAKRCGLSEAGLRRKVKASGWLRVPIEAKRDLVSEAMAGLTSGQTGDEARQALHHEAEVDISDMRRAVRIHRNLLMTLETSSERLRAAKDPDPREAKIVAEATEKAVDGLRRIRELDKPTDIKETEELDAAIEAALAELGTPAQAGPA